MKCSVVVTRPEHSTPPQGNYEKMLNHQVKLGICPVKPRTPRITSWKFQVIIFIFGRDIDLKKFVDGWLGWVGWFLLRLWISRADQYITPNLWTEFLIANLVEYDFISHDLIECEFQFSNVVFMYYLLSYSFIKPLQIQSDY